MKDWLELQLSFLKENFTVAVLSALVVLSAWLVLHLVEWAQGIMSGLLSSLMLALNIRPGKPPGQ